MNMQHIRWKHYIHKTSGEKYLGQYSKKPKHFRDIKIIFCTVIILQKHKYVFYYPYHEKTQGPKYRSTVSPAK